MKKQIKPEQYQKLMQLNDKKGNLEAFIKQVISEGERQMGELNRQAQSIWMDIATDHQLDLRMIDWAPSIKEPNTIVAMQQRFTNG